MADAPTRPEWTKRIYEILKDEFDVKQIAYVPDAGHREMIDMSLADADMHSIPLTTEEEGVALVCGANLGGQNAVVLMQSSGAGNCVNMFSLPRLGKFPMFILLSMRGDFGEGNAWQMPMGKSVEKVLEACDVVCLRIEDAADVEKTVRAGATMAFQARECVAVLLTQKLLGAKAF